MMAQQIKNSGKPLSSLLDGIAEVSHQHDIEVHGLCLDSRKIVPGDCFIALQGDRGHGLQYLDAVISAGARAVLSDQAGQQFADPAERCRIPVIFVDDLRKELGALSNRFYDYPSKRIKTLAITGTNGKTTIASILAEIFEKAHGSAAYIGTLGIGLWHNLEASENTTPDLLTVQRELAGFANGGIKACTLEASSHALDQNRLDGIETDVAVFTNLTHEHLDYHGSMQAYGEAKRRLFDAGARRCAPPSNAVINLDDPYSEKILAQLDPKTVVWPFAFEGKNQDYPGLTFASNVEASLQGISMHVVSPVGEGFIRSKLLGHFNVSNLLATIASLAALGWEFSEIQKALENVAGVPGRMEVIQLVGLSDDSVPAVVIDYAHSPDALRQVLSSLRVLTNGRLICVFGCGGDRDQGKRAQMGAIAEQLADVVVVTTDNPRGEDPTEIIRHVVAGQKKPERTLQEVDRETAIRKAIAMADANDVILIAGKGHETYQIIAQRRVPFSDYEVSRIALSERYVGGGQ